MKTLVAILLLFQTTVVVAQDGRLIPNPIRKIPKWVRAEFASRGMDKSYSIVYQLYPTILRADFNGDRKKDVAIQVEELRTGKMGIAIFHVKNPQAIAAPVSIIGAGRAYGRIDDLKNTNVWGIYTRKMIRDEKHPKKFPDLIANAITIGVRDSSRALIYFDGRKYNWQNIDK